MTYLIKYVFQIKQDLSINVFNKITGKTESKILAKDKITGKTESKILAKDLSCKCKCKFYKRNCNWNQKWNNDKCWCECKKHHIWEKDCIWNPPTCSCENGKYLQVLLTIR